RGGVVDGGHGGGAWPAALARARGGAGWVADQGIRRGSDHFPGGARGHADAARAGGVCGGPDARPAGRGARSGGGAAQLAMFYILLQDFLGDLKTQRTRAFLTFFAVTRGTLAVVLPVWFGEGLKRTVRGRPPRAGE